MIYADYNSTAPMHPEVVSYLQQRLSRGPYANPNSLHYPGRQLLKKITECRAICARFLAASPENIVFNSGASEGIATVFHSCCEKGRETGKNHILISGVEHHAVMNTAGFYGSKGFIIDLVPVDSNGLVNMEFIRNYLKQNSDHTALVCVMAANNETGVIQPFLEVSEICLRHSVPYFCDTTQLIGKHPFEFDNSGLDFAVLSGHKIGALPGIGILLVKNPTALVPLISGTTQENGLRGGTQNYLGIETLALAVEQAEKQIKNSATVQAAKLQFEKDLKKRYPEIFIAGENVARLAATSLLCFPGIYGQAIQIELESSGIYVTTSSACSDNDPAPSHVLKAMNVSSSLARGAVRISLGLEEKSGEKYPPIYSGIVKAYEKLSRIGGY